MKPFLSMLILAASGLIAACQFFGPNSADQTLAVENQVLNTEIAAIRATATVEADRIMITLEHAQTSVSRVDGETQDLQATLIAGGSGPANLQLITPGAPDASGAPAPPTNNTGGQVQPITILPGANTTPIPTQSGLDALIMTPISADAGQQTGGSGLLTNIVMADAVGDDDCAIAPRSSFDAGTTPEIYVVATASGIGAGDTIASDWFVEGQSAATVNYTWTPDFDIDGACIWFFIDQGEVTFTPGTWRVQMAVNGQNEGAPVAFTITGEAPVPAGDAALQDALSGTGPTPLPGTG